VLVIDRSSADFELSICKTKRFYHAGWSKTKGKNIKRKSKPPKLRFNPSTPNNFIVKAGGGFNTFYCAIFCDVLRVFLTISNPGHSITGCLLGLCETPELNSVPSNMGFNDF